jgi:hypothetical protein
MIRKKYVFVALNGLGGNGIRLAMSGLTGLRERNSLKSYLCI